MALRRYLAISIILHVLVIAIALFLVPHKERVIKPFVATIIAPEELKEIRQEKKKQIPIVAGRLDNRGIDLSSKEQRKQTSSPSLSIAQPTPAHKTTSPSDTVPSMRDKLFDREIISKQTQKKTYELLQNKKRSITLKAGKYGNSGWHLRMLERLDSAWNRPNKFARQGTIADGEFDFTIKRNGQLVRAQITRTSGYQGLDYDIIKMLYDANPYWPLPDYIEGDEITLEMYFISVSQ
jgi:hypothetical protein